MDFWCWYPFPKSPFFGSLGNPSLRTDSNYTPRPWIREANTPSPKPSYSLLASTINRYEGMGRALSLKSVKELFNSKGRSVTAAAREASATEKGEAKVHEKWWVARSAAAKKAPTSSDVVGQTLEEDAARGATAAMEILKQQQEGELGSQKKINAVKNSRVTGTRLTPKINDPEIMRYGLNWWRMGQCSQGEGQCPLKSKNHYWVIVP